LPSPQVDPAPAEATSAVSVDLPSAAAPARVTDLPTAAVLTDGDWPQYRGRWRDGIARATGLRREWPAEGPPLLWETPLGQGYSSPSVVGDRVYVNDYDESRSEWMVRCHALSTGEEVWRYTVPKRIRPNHAITRSAPATDGGFVISIDPKCEVHCLDARDGSLIWKKFLPEAYGGQIPAWYNGQCPLLDGEQVILATGGRVLMAAVDKRTGVALWETANESDWSLSHGSIMPVEIDGEKQYTYNTMQGMIGVAADTGALRWKFPWKFNTAVSTMPLPLGEGKFLLTAGYHARTVICQVKQGEAGWIAEEVLSLPPPTVGWNSEVHTPIFHEGRIYGIGKKQRGLWTCLELDGSERWTSAKRAAFGMGGYVLADGMFFVLEGKTGTLRILDAAAPSYEELGHFKLLEGPDVWAPPVIAHQKLLIRDLGRLICLDLAAGDSPKVAAVVPEEH
jgi:outer membrane protein assembly factor BamB